MSEKEEREFLDIEKAKSLLPDRESIHVFSNPRESMLIGADWDLKSINDLLEKSETIEIGGEQCRKMGHGLVVYDGKRHWFIESDKIK